MILHWLLAAATAHAAKLPESHADRACAAVCFAVASEMLLQTQAACGAGGAGGEGGSFEVTTALTVVALVAHLVTVVVGHGYAFEKK